MILLAAFLLLGLAALVDLVRWPGRTAQVPWLLCAAASVLLTVAGGRAVGGHQAHLRVGSLGGLGTTELATDQLSGLFLLLSFGVGFLVLVAAAGLVTSMARPRLAAAVAVSLAAVALILTAQQVFVFLFGWEGLTLGFYLLAGYEWRRAGRGRAAMLAGGFGKLSGGLLMIGFLTLAAHAHSLNFTSLAMVRGGGAWAIGYLLLLIGFGAKVGWLPLQIWIPPAYAAAPGPARPVMAAVAVNVGFYGMWRTLLLLGAPPVWLVVLVLLVAGLTAILGIAHAAVNPDLAYLIAWSSVENAGVISAGYGAALVGAVTHTPRLETVGLLAGFLQITAHAVGKATLFVAAAAAEQELGTTELDQLRGLAKRLPWTTTGLVIGSLTLAGLPLTAGFASEWFTLESLMQQFRIASTPMRLATAFAGALVALTVGVAGVTFVRVVALSAFGHPASPPTILHRPERRWLLKVGMALLATACIALSVLAPLEVDVIGAGLSQLTGDTANTARASTWVLQPVFPDFSALSPTWLAVVLPLMVLAVGVLAFTASGGRMLRVRRVPAWTSASAGVDRQTQYTSFGYANPMRKVLANLLRTRSELSGGSAATVAGSNPEEQSAAAPSSVMHGEGAMGYRVDVVEVIERYLYLPLAAALFAIVRQAKRLQSGRLDAYLAYMLLALVAVLALVAGTS